jgi:hypothetical protein
LPSHTSLIDEGRGFLLSEMDTGTVSTAEMEVEATTRLFAMEGGLSDPLGTILTPLHCSQGRLSISSGRSQELRPLTAFFPAAEEAVVEGLIEGWTKEGTGTMDRGSTTESSTRTGGTSATIMVLEGLGSKIPGVVTEGTKSEEVTVATVREVEVTATAVFERASRSRSSTHTTVIQPKRRMSCSADFGSIEDSRSDGRAVSVRVAERDQGGWSEERG